jgi:thioesterase domain-containing protein
LGVLKGWRLISTKDLEDYLHERIPLSKAMGVEVQAASADRVALRAPLGPNINHQETVFGGSASAVAILAAWALLYVRLQSEGVGGRIVIHRNTMLYERPITGEFLAASTMPDASAWSAFAATLKRKRMARISITSILVSAGMKVGELEGEFVVLPEIA